MNKPRNNCAKLPLEMRKRVYRLLVDGAEYDAIRRDPEVSAACAARGATLHNTTFGAIRRGEEYRRFEAALLGTRERTERSRWAAEAIRASAGLDDVANIAQMSLLEQLRELAERGGGEPGELLKIASAIAKINNPANAAAAQRKIEARDAEIAALRQELAELKQLREAERQRHEAEVAALKEKLAASVGGGIGSRVADEMDKRVGL